MVLLVCWYILKQSFKSSRDAVLKLFIMEFLWSKYNLNMIVCVTKLLIKLWWSRITEVRVQISQCNKTHRYKHSYKLNKWKLMRSYGFLNLSCAIVQTVTFLNTTHNCSCHPSCCSLVKFMDYTLETIMYRITNSTPSQVALGIISLLSLIIMGKSKFLIDYCMVVFSNWVVKSRSNNCQ